MRWLLRRDIDEILEIEKSCFPNPWCENDFVLCLRKETCIGVVLEDLSKNMVGYSVYEFNQNSIDVLNFAINPHQQKKGYGSHMLNSLKNRLEKKRRKFLSTTVAEGNLKAQLFFQKNGFVATNTLKNHWEDGNDAYLMKLFSKPESFMPPNHPFFPTNRISQYMAAN